MKNTHSCPKCQSKNLLHIPGGRDLYNEGRMMIQTGIFTRVYLHRYVCEDCGFSEEWIALEDMKHLQKKYKRLKTKQKKNFTTL